MAGCFRHLESDRRHRPTKGRCTAAADELNTCSRTCPDHVGGQLEHDCSGVPLCASYRGRRGGGAYPPSFGRGRRSSAPDGLASARHRGDGLADALYDLRASNPGTTFLGVVGHREPLARPLSPPTCKQRAHSVVGRLRQANARRRLLFVEVIEVASSPMRSSLGSGFSRTVRRLSSITCCARCARRARRTRKPRPPQTRRCRSPRSLYLPLVSFHVKSVYKQPLAHLSSNSFCRFSAISSPSGCRARSRGIRLIRGAWSPPSGFRYDPSGDAVPPELRRDARSARHARRASHRPCASPSWRRRDTAAVAGSIAAGARDVSRLSAAARRGVARARRPLR